MTRCVYCQTLLPQTQGQICEDCLEWSKQKTWERVKAGTDSTGQVELKAMENHPLMDGFLTNMDFLMREMEEASVTRVSRWPTWKVRDQFSQEQSLTSSEQQGGPIGQSLKPSES